MSWEEENEEIYVNNGETCPHCGSHRYDNVARGEHCHDCGEFTYYP